jgi:hypothetical protein
VALILELRTDQGEIVTRSYQDPAQVFYSEHSPSEPVIQKSFNEIQLGERVAIEPRYFMEIVNMRVT